MQDLSSITGLSSYKSYRVTESCRAGVAGRLAYKAYYKSLIGSYKSYSLLSVLQNFTSLLVLPRIFSRALELKDFLGLFYFARLPQHF